MWNLSSNVKRLSSGLSSRFSSHKRSGSMRLVRNLGVAVALAATLPGCFAHASGEVVYDQPVAYVEEVPPRIEYYPSTSWHGRPAYLVDGHWYYRHDRRWVVLREEPRELYDYRVHRAPAYARGPVRYSDYSPRRDRYADERAAHRRAEQRAAERRADERRAAERRADERRRIEQRQRAERQHEAERRANQRHAVEVAQRRAAEREADRRASAKKVEERREEARRDAHRDRVARDARRRNNARHDVRDHEDRDRRERD